MTAAHKPGGGAGDFATDLLTSNDLNPSFQFFWQTLGQMAPICAKQLSSGSSNPGQAPLSVWESKQISVQVFGFRWF